MRQYRHLTKTQAAAENVLGRPVFTHEFGNQFFVSELKEASKPDFIDICYGGEECSE